MEGEFRLMAAPLQGLTEAAWRSAHYGMYGPAQGDVEYFTPFVRVEKGEVRARDLRDFTSELNAGMDLTPQIIFRDTGEWRMLVDTLAEAGARRVDMNLGCPFVPQVRKGRGAGLLRHPDVLGEVCGLMWQYAADVEFSVKMRLGVDSPDEALALTDILNEMPLRHVTIHPRTAAQQYKGALSPGDMAALSSRLTHPVVFNGEVTTPADIEALRPAYAGVMVGRGLLERPSLFAEYRSGAELPAADRAAAFLSLIGATSSILAGRLCGAAQLRDKLKPYWDYAPAALDRKTVKQGKKHGIPCHQP